MRSYLLLPSDASPILLNPTLPAKSSTKRVLSTQTGVGCDHQYWGYADSNPIADPNPRLEALIAAARRGARVRVLLDSYFDDAEALRSNRATVEYLNALAQREGLDLQAATGNPTRRGIHMKLVLVQVGGEMWIALGSLNGGEISHKVNREAVLLVDQSLVYARLREVFLHDWVTTTVQ